MTAIATFTDREAAELAASRLAQSGDWSITRVQRAGRSPLYELSVVAEVHPAARAAVADLPKSSLIRCPQCGSPRVVLAARDSTRPCGADDEDMADAEQSEVKAVPVRCSTCHHSWCA